MDIDPQPESSNPRIGNTENCPLKPILKIEYSINEKTKRRVIHRKFICPIPECSETFYFNNSFLRHSYINHFCEVCKFAFRDLKTHLCVPQVGGQQEQDDVEIDSGQFSVSDNIYRGTLHTFDLNFTQHFDSIESCFDYTMNDLQLILRQSIQKYNGIKASITLNCDMVDLKNEIRKPFSFFSPFQPYLSPNYITTSVKASCAYVLASLSVFADGSSGFRLDKINFMTVRIVNYTPLVARGSDIETPLGLNRKYVLNLKVKTRCFAYCIVAATCKDSITLADMPNTEYKKLNRNQKKQLNRKRQNPKYYELFLNDAIKTGRINFDLVLEEASLESIDFFEMNNPEYSVTVFTHIKGKQITPVRVTKEVKRIHVDLLLIKKPIGNVLPDNSIDIEFVYHYCLINLPSLMGKHNFHRSEICPYCFKKYKIGLESHQKICGMNNMSRITFPKSKYYEFKKQFMREDIPFKIVFAFQYYKDQNHANTDTNIPLKPLAYSLIMLGPFDYQKNQVLVIDYYDGEDVVQKFLNKIQELCSAVEFITRKFTIAVDMTQNDITNHVLATHCEFCKKRFSYDVIKVVDHDHFDGRYRRALCSVCNINCRLQAKPILVGHNISDRELHTILKSLDSEQLQKAKVIFKSTEELVSLSINGCRFFDIANFLKSDLFELVHTYKKGLVKDELPEKFQTFYQIFPRHDYTLYLFRELPFPYRYVDSQSKLKDVDFPSIDQFENLESGQDIEDDEYNVAFACFTNLCKNSLSRYTKLVLDARVALTCDIMLKLVSYLMDNFGLSVLHTYSIGHFSHEAAFASIEEPYEHIQCIEKLEFIKSCVRGAASMSVVRYAESNVPSLKPFWNGDEKDQKRCMYIDANMCYLASLLGHVPWSGFKFLSDQEFQDLDILNVPDDSPIGYICSVTLHYPKELHLDHDHFPCILNRRIVNQSEISNVQQKLFEQLEGEIANPFCSYKILADFLDKEEYTTYYVNLKYYVSLGVQIKKRHKCLSFRQVPNFKDFLLKTVESRKENKAKGDEIGALLDKLLSVNLAGKLLSSTEKYTDIKPCSNKYDAMKFVAKHNFLDYKILNKELDTCLFTFKRSTVYYQYNMAAGAVCLENSKIMLHKAFMLIKKTFPGTKLIFSETDSLAMCCPIKNDKHYIEELRKLSWFFDFSSLHPMHTLYSKENYLKPGCWKPVHFNILSIVSLRPKMYSVLVKCMKCGNNGEEDCPCSRTKTASSVRPQVLAKIDHKFYKQCLFGRVEKQIPCSFIQSRNHELEIVQSDNHGFHSLNVRRFLLDDQINSIAFGSYLLNEDSE